MCDMALIELAESVDDQRIGGLSISILADSRCPIPLIGYYGNIWQLVFCARK